MDQHRRRPALDAGGGRHAGGGRFAVSAVYPDYARTTGAVSLRVQTWDTDGDTLTQTTLRAFGLRDHTPTNAS